MRTGHLGRTGRIWPIGGVLGAAALLAIGWFFFIGPQNDQTGRLQDQADAARLRLSSLQHRLAELRLQNGDLPRYRAQLALDRQALPQTSGLPDFLRELHAAADGRGVAVSGLVVGTAGTVAGSATPVYALPVTLTAVGTTATLNPFLDQLQRVQPRAVLVNTVNTVTNTTAAQAGTVTLTLTMQVFVAPAIGGSTPASATVR
jgi:Tfp pilus assembly protein PilO